MRNDLVQRLQCGVPYCVGRFILQVVGSVRSAARQSSNSVFQPRPVFSASYFDALVNTAS